MGNKRSRLNQNSNIQRLILKDREMDKTQRLILQDLEAKRSAILSRANNDPKIETDFRWTCAVFENQKSDSNPQLNEAYQKYIRAYHKITSLYALHWDSEGNTFLHIFDTENESEKIIKLEVPEPLTSIACLAVLPNDELFSFGDSSNLGITFIIDKDYEVRILPKGEPCSNSSAIYFNRNVYCFGGINNYYTLPLSCKYDLDKKNGLN